MMDGPTSRPGHPPQSIPALGTKHLSESVEFSQQSFVKAKCFLKAPERTGCCMSCSTQARNLSNKVLITPARIISVGGIDREKLNQSSFTKGVRYMITK